VSAERTPVTLFHYDGPIRRPEAIDREQASQLEVLAKRRQADDDPDPEWVRLFLAIAVPAVVAILVGLVAWAFRFLARVPW
jgi:hypothetical protein